ncbi:MAG: hypothetical protein HY974_01865 [Candidatus Kerfeldbacteria bacterium]|nr:hypothetical protein [Candidatus Kerfeldbacteria bacterium]
MEQIINSPWFIPLAVAWSLPWKGVALWRAARRDERWWFIVLLVVNTLAILEILYIFIFSRRPQTSTVVRPEV